MKIFLSSLSLSVIKKLHEINPSLKPNVLITFYGLENPKEYTRIHRNKINGLILDCGTFSLNRKKLRKESHRIECDSLFLQYKDYVKLTKDDYDFLFSFDGDFNPNGFDNNLEHLYELEAAGVRVVPVIHNLHNHEIDYFIDERPKYPIVAIGQCLADERDNLETLFEAVDKLYRNGIKVHLFGMTTPSLISYVPAYSCDSVTWMEYASRGRVLFHDPDSGVMNHEELIYFPSKQNYGDPGNAIDYRKYKHLDSFKSHIKAKLNLVVDDLIAEQTQAMSLALVNALYFMELEERITAENRLRGITFE